MDLSVQGREVCLEAFRYLENVTVYQLKVIRYYRQPHIFSENSVFSLQQMFSLHPLKIFGGMSEFAICAMN
jgi:hypothetical protein